MHEVYFDVDTFTCSEESRSCPPTVHTIACGLAHSTHCIVLRCSSTRQLHLGAAIAQVQEGEVGVHRTLMGVCAWASLGPKLLRLFDTDTFQSDAAINAHTRGNTLQRKLICQRHCFLPRATRVTLLFHWQMECISVAESITCWCVCMNQPSNEFDETN